MKSKNLYLFKQNINKWILLEGKAQKYIANEIGISNIYLSHVINGKKACSKAVAYAITKCVSNNKKVEDLFTRKED